jgi:peptidoglycan/LPS O-acetylase OafA/YrhL
LDTIFIKQRIRQSFHKACCLTHWLLAAGIALSCVYGLAQYNPVSGKTPSLAEVVIYNGSNRLPWSCAVSWVIVACIKKRGGPVNEFLSWSCFIPLAHISYCMNLIHISVLLRHNSVLRDGISYGTEQITYTIIGNIVVTGAISIVLMVAFEMPALHVEKLAIGLLGVGACHMLRGIRGRKKVRMLQ